MKRYLLHLEKIHASSWISNDDDCLGCYKIKATINSMKEVVLNIYREVRVN